MLFLRGFILKPTERAYILLKSGTTHFQNSHPLERSTCFYVVISGNFERNTLILTQIFWKTKNFFKKLEYCILVESTKIENASYP